MSISQRLSFYSFPSRAWELLIGVLAFEITGSQNRWREIVNKLSLVVIVVGLYFADSGPYFPSISALLTSLGTGLFLSTLSMQTIPSRFLSSPPLVWLGVRSYSIYLWHLPILIYAEYVMSGLGIRILIPLLIILLISDLSFRFIEIKFRAKSGRDFLRSGSRLLTLGLCITLLCQSFTAYYKSDYKRVNFLETFLDYDSSIVMNSPACFVESGQPDSFEKQCIILNAANRIVIWGDSHAASLSYGLRSEIGEISQLTYSGCPPILHSGSISKECRINNSNVEDILKFIKPTVIL